MLPVYDDDIILDIIGNNTRRKILATLAQEPMYFNQLAKEISIGQQAILRHMKTLEDMGLIESYAEKSNLGAPDRKYYRLNSSFSLTICLSEDAFSIKSHKIEQYRHKESDKFYEEYDLLAQEDDGETLNQLQSNLTKIEMEISNLDSRLNDLRALKQLIVSRLRHAEVLALDDHNHPARLQDVVDRVGDLGGESFLHLRSLGVDVNEAGQLAEPGDLPV